MSVIDATTRCVAFDDLNTHCDGGGGLDVSLKIRWYLEGDNMIRCSLIVFNECWDVQDNNERRDKRKQLLEGSLR